MDDIMSWTQELASLQGWSPSSKKRLFFLHWAKTHQGQQIVSCLGYYYIFATMIFLFFILISLFLQGTHNSIHGPSISFYPHNNPLG